MQQSTIRNTIPGTFALPGAQDTSSIPRLSGAKSNIFQPPSTSAASSLYLSQSHAPNNLNDGPIAGSRKRSRTDYSSRDEGRGGNSNVMPGMNEEWGSRSVEMTDPGSPMPFVNTRYMIAGGMDTPSQALEAAAVRQDYGRTEFEDLGYRRERSGTTRQSMFEDHSTVEPDYFSITEMNGRPRTFLAEKPNNGGWNITKVVGEVVGKVWEFCKLSGAAFRGFHAGGGKGYNTNLQPEDSNMFWMEKNGEALRESTPIPGAWTAVGAEDLDFIPDYSATPDETNTPPRPAKRRQICTPRDEIAKNWVVVPPTSDATPSKPQQSRGPARYSLPTASSVNRRGSFLPISATSTVSTLPRPRRSLLPCRPSTSHTGSPFQHQQKPVSYSSPRSPANSNTSRIPTRTSRESTPQKKLASCNTVDSPAAREAQKWAAVKLKEEREADESIRRLDRQLKAMIREGKEALGSSVSVEMEVEGDFVGGSGGNGGYARDASVAGVGGVRKWAV